MCERMNKKLERAAVGYSFGPGAGPCLVTTDADAPGVMWRLLYHFPPDPRQDIEDYHAVGRDTATQFQKGGRGGISGNPRG